MVHLGPTSLFKWGLPFDGILTIDLFLALGFFFLFVCLHKDENMDFL